MIHHFTDRVVGGKEGREHRAADVGRVRTGNDGFLDFDAATDRDRGTATARRAGVRHDHAALHHRDVQQLRHALARSGNVRRFLGRFGLDRLGERSRLVARQDHGELLREFGLKRGQDIGTREPCRLQVAGTAQGRSKAAAFVPPGSDKIAGFDFHVHE